MMNSTGIYSMLSAFFLAVVLVFIVLALVYINLLVVSQESTIFKGVKPFELASDVKNKIIEHEDCFDGRIVSDEIAFKKSDGAAFNPIGCGNKMIQLSEGQVAGFSVERLEHLDCSALKEEIGELNECTHRFVFFINSYMEGEYKNCLGKMIICMSVEK